MARYFFDIVNGGVSVDDEGIEFQDAKAASQEALQTLPELAMDGLADKDGEQVSVMMRDASGRAIYRATLTIHSQWLVERPPI